MRMDTQRRGWLAGEGRLPRGVPRMLAERTFRQDDVPAVRRFGEAFGVRAGLGSARLADFVLAVSEAAACATAWGPCTARIRLWMSGSRACCEVRGGASWQGTGLPDEPRGEVAALRGWVLKQVCDYVSVASGPGSAWVFLSMSVASA